MKERKITKEMLDAFLHGELHPLLEAVKKDDTLDLELRGNSVNIYYRGGSLFKITEKKGNYTVLQFRIAYKISVISQKGLEIVEVTGDALSRDCVLICQRLHRQVFTTQCAEENLQNSILFCVFQMIPPFS